MARLRDYHYYVANCHFYVLPFENRTLESPVFRWIRYSGVQNSDDYCNFLMFFQVWFDFQRSQINFVENCQEAQFFVSSLHQLFRCKHQLWRRNRCVINDYYSGDSKIGHPKSRNVSKNMVSIMYSGDSSGNPGGVRTRQLFVMLFIWAGTWQRNLHMCSLM